MDPLNLRGGPKPETILQGKIISKLEKYGWFVMVTHGNAYQHGFPDLWCMHPRYGYRWIEVKMPLTGRYTTAQLEHFHRFAACHIGIWVLTSDEDSEIDKLFKEPNWTFFLPIMKA